MGRGDISLACATALVDALALARRARRLPVSPGSRSTPFALALARDERIRVHVHLDERGAAFFALGLATGGGAPVALACTSGTAAAEYFPAIVEASQARVPLVALTADRPPRLRGTGANQTIDQTELYGRYVRAYLEPPVPDALGDAEAWFDAGLRACEAAAGAPPGPVQVNACFEEPLVPDQQGAAAWSRRVAPAAPARSPDHDAAVAALTAFRDALRRPPRCDRTWGRARPPATLSLLSLGTLLGWPVLAEPLSGLRLDAGRAGRAMAAGQFVIGDDAWLAAHRPEVVLQVGATPTTRATQRWWRRPTRSWCWIATTRIRTPRGGPSGASRSNPSCSPPSPGTSAMACGSRRPTLGGRTPGARPISSAATPSICCSTPGTIRSRAGSRATSHPSCPTARRSWSAPRRRCGTSISFMAPRRPPRIWTAPDLLHVVGNRGASGIDGLVATTLGPGGRQPRRDVRTARRPVLPRTTRARSCGPRRWASTRCSSCSRTVAARSSRCSIKRSLPEHRRAVHDAAPGTDPGGLRGGRRRACGRRPGRCT